MQQGTDWFLRRALRQLVVKHRDAILMGRYIFKQRLYCEMSWMFRASKRETRELLKLMSRRCPGIVYSPRGLRIPVVYLDESKWDQLLALGSESATPPKGQAVLSAFLEPHEEREAAKRSETGD